MTPKIAIVHDWFITYAGAERVVEQMLQVFPHADLFALLDFMTGRERGMLQGKPVRTSFLQTFPFLNRRNYRNFLPLMPLAIEQARCQRLRCRSDRLPRRLQRRHHQPGAAAHQLHSHPHALRLGYAKRLPDRERHEVPEIGAGAPDLCITSACGIPPLPAARMFSTATPPSSAAASRKSTAAQPKFSTRRWTPITLPFTLKKKIST